MVKTPFLDLTIEAGGRHPTLEVLRSIAAGLDVDVAELLGDGEERKRITDAAVRRLIAASAELPPADLRLLTELALRLGKIEQPASLHDKRPSYSKAKSRK